MNLESILKNYESTIDYGDFIIDGIDNNELILDLINDHYFKEELRHKDLKKEIRHKYNKNKIESLDYTDQLINLINLNLIYLGEENLISKILKNSYKGNEYSTMLIENILLSFFIGENPYLIIKNGEIGIVEEKKLLLNIGNNFGVVKYFSIGNILKLILPKELKKEVSKYKKSISKELKDEVNTINNIDTTIDKLKIIEHKIEILGQVLLQYEEEIKEILKKKKGITDPQLLHEYSEKLNEGLYKFAGISTLY